MYYTVEPLSITNNLGPEGVRYSEMFILMKPIGKGDNFPFLSQLYVLLLLLWVCYTEMLAIVSFVILL